MNNISKDFMTIDGEVLNSKQMKDKLEAIKIRMLQENYLINICKILTLKGVEGISIYLGENKTNSYTHPKGIKIEDIHEELYTTYHYYFIKIYGDSEKIEKIKKQALKYLQAARGCASDIGSNFRISLENCIKNNKDHIITKENYQDFICDALQDEKRKIYIEQEKINETLSNDTQVYQPKKKNIL